MTLSRIQHPSSINLFAAQITGLAMASGMYQWFIAFSTAGPMRSNLVDIFVTPEFNFPTVSCV